MTEHILEVMGGLDPALIEEVDLSVKKRGRKFSPLRGGLIAACLCLAMVGTGFAARQVYHLMVQTVAREESPGYMVQGEVEKYPLQDFSDALLAASETRYAPGAVEQLHFDIFDEVRAFLGEDIPALWPSGGEDWNGSFSVYLFHTEIDKLWKVEVYSFDVEAQAAITMNIYTEHWRGKRDTNIVERYANADNTIEQLESCLMSNGTTAEIILQTGTAEYPDCHCFGYFICDGVLYDVEVIDGLSNRDELLPRLKAVLDSFA